MRGKTRNGSNTSGNRERWQEPVSETPEESTATVRLATDPEREGVWAAPAGDATRNVAFELTAEKGSLVCVAGTFNNWSPTANPMDDSLDSGHFRTTVDIPQGRHEYKFVVNGVWCSDPNCPDWASNDQGSINSVIQVGADTTTPG